MRHPSNVEKIFVWHERQGLDAQGKPVVYAVREDHPDHPAKKCANKSKQGDGKACPRTVV